MTERDLGVLCKELDFEFRYDSVVRPDLGRWPELDEDVDLLVEAVRRTASSKGERCTCEAVCLALFGVLELY